MSTNIADDVRNFYRGEQGRHYYKNVRDPRQHVSEVVAQQRKLKFQPLVSHDDTVLEFGAGTGFNLRRLECCRRIAYDLSDFGRDACENAGIEFVTDLGCLQKLSFDVVICHHVLEHVPDPVETLRIIQSYLKPEGRLLLFVPFETNRSFRKYYPGDRNKHLFSWNALTMGNLVAAAGYSIHLVKTKPFGYEQHLAPLARYSRFAYSAGLWLIRKIRPVEEIMVVATKADRSTLNKETGKWQHNMQIQQTEPGA